MPTEKRTLVLDSNSPAGLEDFYLTVNDSLPSLEYTLSRADSTGPNLKNKTANLKVRQLDSTSNLFDISIVSSCATSAGQITSDSSSVIQYDWTTGSWPSSGSFIGEISITSSSGRIETATDRQTFIVENEF